MPKIKGGGLSEKQKLFVQEYLIDFNATRAAKAAGYSEKTAQQMGAENLLKPLIRDAIKSAVDERNKIIGADQLYVVQKARQVVEADYVKYVHLGEEGVDQKLS